MELENLFVLGRQDCEWGENAKKKATLNTF